MLTKSQNMPFYTFNQQKYFLCLVFLKFVIRTSSSSSSSSGNSSIFGLSGGGRAVWRLKTEKSHLQNCCRYGGAGCIIVDGVGTPVAAFCRAVHEENSQVHELQAIVEGLRLAEPLGIRRIVVATDSLNPKDHLRKAEGGKLPTETLATVRELFLETGEVRRRFRTCEVGWVPNKSNGVAPFFLENEGSEFGRERTEGSKA